MNLPANVRSLLSVFTLGISFGLGGLTDVLACLGFDHFIDRLIFWMVLPLLLVLFVFVASVVRLVLTCKPSSAALVETALPIILRVLFLLYPIVTNTAFEAVRARWSNLRATTVY